jgi:regulator of protease activity HflC (stomatin/prohibitin superfamily)
MMSAALFVALVFAAFVLFVLVKTAVVVPQQNAFVVERLGKFSGVLEAGFHILVPFVDAIRYRLSLKEQALDIPEQICITRDNVTVGVDGVIYLKVLDPERASYGISDYFFAITQLAQTTLRSEIGKIELDRTFEERTHINSQVVSELDKATDSWGIKVLRYEIKNITPPRDVLAAMEKQMRAEREKRAVILTSEGERDAAINSAEGEKQQVIKASEANRQQQINEALGQAEAILAVTEATATGIKRVADAINQPGGVDAVRLRVAEQYVTQFGNLAKASNTLVVPANLSDVASMIAMASNVIHATTATSGGTAPAKPRGGGSDPGPRNPS